MSTLMFDRLAAALGKAYAQIPFKVAAQDDTHHDGTIHECARDAVDGLVDTIIAAAEFDPKRFKAAVEEAKAYSWKTLEPEFHATRVQHHVLNWQQTGHVNHHGRMTAYWEARSKEEDQ